MCKCVCKLECVWGMYVCSVCVCPVCVCAHMHFLSVSCVFLPFIHVTTGGGGEETDTKCNVRCALVFVVM